MGFILNSLLLSATLVGCTASCQSKTDTVRFGDRQYTVTTRSKDSAQADKRLPRPLGYVIDFEGLLTPEQRQVLEKTVSEFEAKTSVEVAVVTVQASMTDTAGFDNYTLQLAKEWGVGKKEKNNGVLIAFSAGLRHIRIQNGLGIEKLMSDAETKGIVDGVFIPHFRNGDFYKGASEGLNAIIQLLTKKMSVPAKQL